MASRVVHFEIPASDPESAARFYSAAFGWRIDKWDGPQEYWLVTTGEGQPGIDGGIMQRTNTFERVVNTVNVDDIDSAAARIGELGGTLVGERFTIPGIGDMWYAQDPDGNTFGMLQLVEAAAAT